MIRDSCQGCREHQVALRKRQRCPWLKSLRKTQFFQPLLFVVVAPLAYGRMDKHFVRAQVCVFTFLERRTVSRILTEIVKPLIAYEGLCSVLPRKFTLSVFGKGGVFYRLNGPSPLVMNFWDETEHGVATAVAMADLTRLKISSPRVILYSKRCAPQFPIGKTDGDVLFRSIM